MEIRIGNPKEKRVVMMDSETVIAHFENCARDLRDVAPSEKARLFALAVAGQVRGRGIAWIAEFYNSLSLHLGNPEFQQFADVESNRKNLLATWQLRLATGEHMHVQKPKAKK